MAKGNIGILFDIQQLPFSGNKLAFLLVYPYQI
jgi:hypothetical protein